MISAILGPSVYGQNRTEVKSLSPQEYNCLIHTDSSAVILDVRREQEYKESHLEGAILLDILSSESFDAGLKEFDKEKTYYLYCKSGRRSKLAALRMQKEGFKVFEMEGGIQAWIKSDMPTINP